MMKGCDGRFKRKRNLLQEYNFLFGTNGYLFHFIYHLIEFATGFFKCLKMLCFKHLNHHFRNQSSGILKKTTAFQKTHQRKKKNPV